MLVACGTAGALEARRSIHQLHHTAWTVNEGAPGQVTALAQTADGFLWLGTEVGLFRFDGLQFERYEAPASAPFPATSVSALYAPPSGGLWIGFRYGGLSFLDGQRLVHYGEAEGLRLSTVFRLAQDHDGTLWAATFRGLARLRDGRWDQADPEWRIPGQQAHTVFVDASGTLWVATDDGLAVLRKGQARFERVQARVGRVNGIGQAPDGAIWISEADASGAVRRLTPQDGGASSPRLDHPSSDLLFDGDGVLWATTLGEGLVRNPALAEGTGTNRFERFRQPDGLSSDYLRPILQDREGNIWVGGSRGLDRFRHTHLVLAPLAEGTQDFAIAADAGGALLVGSRNRPLTRTDGDRTDRLGLPPPVTAAHRDAGGTVWLGGPEGIWKYEDGAITPAAPLPVTDHTGVQALARTTDGAVWVSLNTPGVYRLQDGGWRRFGRADGMPGGAAPLVLQPGSDGRLWMGFAHNIVGILQGNRIGLLRSEDGLALGNVTALAEGREGIWMGGERGLALYAGGEIRHVVAAGDPFRGISGIIEDAAGDLWLNAAPGIIHVRAAQVENLLRSGAELEYELLDALDGLPGIPAQFRPIPTATAGTGGRLWFATTGGVVSLDPAAMRRNPLPPPVAIRELRVDGQAQPLAGGDLRLPAGTGNLQIGYTALSLSVPERVRFRYRLEGFDAHWQDAGTRRVAFYNDPGPGTYTFRVVAANPDGVWNETGSSLHFVIAPRYYQTAWFRVLCAVLVLAALWVAYLLRLRHLSGQIRMRLTERHDERERIARELHDTLLQGVQGLILRLHATAGRLKPGDPLREELDTAMDRAEKTMAQGRERVRGLRGEFRHSQDLGSALSHVLDEAQERSLPDLKLTLRGQPRELVPWVAEEIYMIGREALLNAFRHSRARVVEIDLDFDPDELRLRIRDDGIGIGGAKEEPPRPGHWGLEGMQERAGHIGAALRIFARAEGGTEADLVVPGTAAYPGRTSSSIWARLRAALLPGNNP